MGKKEEIPTVSRTVLVPDPTTVRADSRRPRVSIASSVTSDVSTDDGETGNVDTMTHKRPKLRRWGQLSCDDSISSSPSPNSDPYCFFILLHGPLFGRSDIIVTVYSTWIKRVICLSISSLGRSVHNPFNKKIKLVIHTLLQRVTSWNETIN